MATIVNRKPTPPKEIKKFFGLNENNDGEVGLKLGEATTQLNFRVTNNYQLKKREGYKTYCSGLGGDVRAMWYGKLNNTNMLLAVANGQLHSVDVVALAATPLVTLASTPIGTLTDDTTNIIPFGNKVYINNGNEYISYDGTTFAEVEGYIPKIAIGTPYSGGGTDFEQTNVLTGKKHQTFNGDGSHTVFQLRETSINSVDQVYVNGVLKTVTTDYSVNLTNGTVTFVVAPSNVPDNVDIYWTKGSGNREYIEKCKFSMDYSGQTDNRIFLWGNLDSKNRRYWSGIANGTPSAEYFEANSYDDLGNGQYAITDIVKQYDRQKIFLEDRVMYSYYEAQNTTTTVNDVDVTVTTATFPAFELNEEIGNIAYGQVQVVKNSPLSLYNSGVHSFNGSTVRDQTNQELISERVNDSLIPNNLSTAITTVWRKKNEYWCNIGDKVWVYNYVNNTWYKFDNITATCFLEIDGDLYFGTANGTIEKFDESNLNDNGTAIIAEWEMGFYDFDAEWLTKYINNLWISIAPQAVNRVDVYYKTNNDDLSTVETIEYQLSTFENMNFADFSFNTNYDPQPFYIFVQATEFCYFKIILKNISTTTTTTIISINMPARFGGRVV
jgi:hypothetical protein